MIDALLPVLAHRLDGDAVAVGGWIARARLVHLGSKWEGRAVFVLFAPSDPGARVVVKADRTRRGRRRLRREHDALRSVAAIPRLAGTVPRNLALFEHGSTLVLAQTALDGPTLAVDLRRRLRPTGRRVRAHHDLVLTWLADLQARPVDSGPAPAGRRPRRRIDADQIVALAEQALPRGESWATRTVGRVTALGRDLGPIDLPLARGHGDLGPSNVIVLPDGGRRRVGVLDWEGAGTQVPVLNDVLMFLHHYARATPAPRHGLMDRHEVAAAAFLGSGVLARQTWRRWCDALAGIGLPVAAARYTLLAMLLQFAANATEYAHSDRVSLMWTEITRHYSRQWARHGFPESTA